ncbi:MAG: FlgD immunoglobulin-like domain containing protein, partial [Thermoleophilia bacterium]|nr:FlgD immunoglobulin-like domain containing protein [Thermoleophilia bacterium]
GMRPPGRYRVPFPPPPRPVEGLPPAGATPPAQDGRWTLRVSATDEAGLASSSAVSFHVNTTLGFLRVSPRTLRLRPRAVATARWTLARPAVVVLTVETRAGRVLREIPLGRLAPGARLATWDGRLSDGRLAPAGGYLLRVAARNALGEVSLARPLVVRRPPSAAEARGPGH